MKNNNTVMLIVTALLAAIMCILSPLTISLGPVPVSLATLVVYTMLCVFDVKLVVYAVVVYIVIGLAGIPVFSGFSGGPGHLLGPIGGFIMGYIALCLVSGYGIKIYRRRTGKNKERVDGRQNGQKRAALVNFAALLAGTVILYMFGTMWYIMVMSCDLWQAVIVCVVPFILTDFTKMVFSVWLGNILKKRLLNTGFDKYLIR